MRGGSAHNGNSQYNGNSFANGSTDIGNGLNNLNELWVGWNDPRAGI